MAVVLNEILQIGFFISTVILIQLTCYCGLHFFGQLLLTIHSL
ncbi:hypothetical protein EVA_10659 [gut metagenome]|uniref:Uncharacterized protein n=1 Tax=gut metagenome TaxID=749906 RepID=J9G310_9ZZZZ